jgi:hypothetical protein
MRSCVSLTVLMAGTTRRFAAVAGVVVASLALLVGGCSGSVGTAPTSPAAGVVSLGGQPVADVNVTFTPTAGRSATGRTDAQGRFALSTFAEGDGAVPGSHRVTLSLPAADVPMPGTPEAASYKPPTAPFPARYGSLDETDLVVEIPAGGNTAIALELKAD